MTHTVTLALSEEEYEQVRQRAARLHMDVVTYVRWQTLNSPSVTLETQDVGSNLERRRGRGGACPAAE
jgi:hypothetical protein